MVMYPQMITGAWLFGVVGDHAIIHSGSDFGQIFAAAERTDPTGSKAHSASLRWQFARRQTGGQRKDVSSSAS